MKNASVCWPVISQLRPETISFSKRKPQGLFPLRLRRKRGSATTLCSLVIAGSAYNLFTYFKNALYRKENRLSVVMKIYAYMTLTHINKRAYTHTLRIIKLITKMALVLGFS